MSNELNVKVEEVGVEKIEETIDKLNRFKNAFEELKSDWDKQDILNLTESISKYPFKKSFDELLVSAWVDDSVEELESIIKK